MSGSVPRDPTLAWESDPGLQASIPAWGLQSQPPPQGPATAWNPDPQSRGHSPPWGSNPSPLAPSPPWESKPQPHGAPGASESKDSLSQEDYKYLLELSQVEDADSGSRHRYPGHAAKNRYSGFETGQYYREGTDPAPPATVAWKQGDHWGRAPGRSPWGSDTPSKPRDRPGYLDHAPAASIHLHLGDHGTDHMYLNERGNDRMIQQKSNASVIGFELTPLLPSRIWIKIHVSKADTKFVPLE